jgi:hypothetical protein
MIVEMEAAEESPSITSTSGVSRLHKLFETLSAENSHWMISTNATRNLMVYN